MNEQEKPPNVLPLSCAAPIDRDHVCVYLALKNAPILRPHSGVSYSGVLGRVVEAGKLYI